MSTEAETPAESAILGTDESVMDDKGRILIGKARRDRLGSSFVISLGSFNQIVMHPRWAWTELMNDILSLPSTSRHRQTLSRYLFGSAYEGMEFDGQGRVVIPQKIRVAAGYEVDGKIVPNIKALAMGMGDRLEAWTEAAWKEFGTHGSSSNPVRRRQEIDEALVGIESLPRSFSDARPYLRLVGE